jgi:hypothetical protein
MNKRNAIILTSVLLLTFSFLAGGIIISSADTSEENDKVSENPPIKHYRGFCGPMFGAIDDELRVEMHETIKKMKDEGAIFEEIREYIQNFLIENGIEPKRPELTEEQLEALKQLREDVRAYAEKRAAELGLELPENGFFGGCGMGFRGFRRGVGLRRHFKGSW